MSQDPNNLEEFVEDVVEEVQEEWEELEEKTESFFTKAKTWLFNFWKEWKVLIASCVLIIIAQYGTIKYYLSDSVNVEPKQEIKQQELNLLKERLSKDIDEKADFIQLDLSKFKITKVRETESLKSGKNIFGVWRELETPNDKQINSVYFVLYENIDSLNYNKAEYEKYVKEQTEKILTDTKKDK